MNYAPIGGGGPQQRQFQGQQQRQFQGQQRFNQRPQQGQQRFNQRPQQQMQFHKDNKNKAVLDPIISYSQVSTVNIAKNF